MIGDSHSSIKQRVADRRRSLTATIERLVDDSSTDREETVTLLQRELHKLDEITRDGWDRLDDRMVARLEQWLADTGSQSGE